MLRSTNYRLRQLREPLWNERRTLQRASIKDIAEQLGSSDWLRVHRGMLVRKRRMSTVHSLGKGAWEVETDDGERFTIDARFLSALGEAFDQAPQ